LTNNKPTILGKITDLNLEDYYEFSEEEFLGRTDCSCGLCKGKGYYYYKKKKTECDECNGIGEITDETNPDHECQEWEANDIDFDDETHASIDRECPICHQLSRLHFWRKKDE
jgi:DnaJ-class molecular chaperone